MVWILQGLTINLVNVFLDSTHLPLFVMESLQNGKKYRDLLANIEFRTPLPNSINVIMYMEFDNNIFVHKTRHITKDS